MGLFRSSQDRAKVKRSGKKKFSRPLDIVPKKCYALPVKEVPR